MPLATSESILDHVIDQLPEAFFDYLAKHQRSVYEEVDASIQDPKYSVVEGRYFSGHLRRGLMENLFRQAAEHSKLKWADVKHPFGRFSCVHIFAGNLQITTHHVMSPKEFVRPCASRQQDAAVNKFLDGYYLAGTLLAPLPTLQSATAIQMYLLHGQKYADAESQFMSLAVPDSQLKLYQWQRTFPELRQAYLDRSRPHTEAVNYSAEPKPRSKRLKKEVAS